MGIRSSNKTVEPKGRKSVAAKSSSSAPRSASKDKVGETRKYSQTGAPWWKTFLPD